MRVGETRFVGLFEAEADALFRFALRMLRDPEDAEDAVQDAFLRLARRDDRPASFRNPRAWLFAVLRSVCLDRLRARARTAEAAAWDGARDAPIDLVTPEESVIDAERLARVEAAIAALPPIEAEVFSLVVIEGMSYSEAAEATGAAIGSVRSRLHRARNRLRLALSDPQTAADRPGAGQVVAFRRRAT